MCRVALVRHGHEAAAKVGRSTHRVEERANRVGLEIERDQHCIVAVLGEAFVENTRCHDLYHWTPDDGEQCSGARGDQTTVRAAARIAAR